MSEENRRRRKVKAEILPDLPDTPADAATINKVYQRLGGARASCLAAARECEILQNWLANRKPNVV